MNPVSCLRGVPIVLGTLLLVPAPVWAAPQELVQQLTECARMADPAKRLECYDALARRFVETPPGPDNPKRKWGVNIKVSPIDDAKIVTLYLEAAGTEPSVEKAPFLFLRCRRGETNAYITWNKRLAHGEVVVRLGKKAAERQYWNLSTDNEATFYAGDSVAFIRSLMESDRLVAQVDLKGEGSVSAVFELAGLASAVTPLRDSCRW